MIISKEFTESATNDNQMDDNSDVYYHYIAQRLPSSKGLKKSDKGGMADFKHNNITTFRELLISALPEKRHHHNELYIRRKVRSAKPPS